MEIITLKFRSIDTLYEFDIFHRDHIREMFNRHFVTDEYDLLEAQVLVRGTDIINLIVDGKNKIHIYNNEPLVYSFSKYFDKVKTDKERIIDLEERLERLEELVYQIKGLV